MKSIATNPGSTNFANAFRSPLPVADQLEAPFANLDDDDFGMSDSLPQETRSTSFDTPDDGIHRSTTVMKSTSDGPVYRLIPKKRDHPMEEGRNPVPASLIRKIERELRDETCDPRIVFQACRNMPRGSREFDTAYTSARISAYASQPRRTSTTPAPMVASEFAPAPAWQWTAGNTAPLANQHPLAVWSLGDLMSHLGILVIAVFAAQTLASWKIGGFLNRYLEGGHGFYFAATLLLMGSLNAYVWFRRRGQLFDQFVGPGVVLFLLAVVPALALHVASRLNALG